jgi:hypothetical protein
MSFGGQIGLFCRPPPKIHSMDRNPSIEHQSYCTVEEIKEGKRQRAEKGQRQQPKVEEENYYEEQDDDDEEGDEGGNGNGQKEGGRGHYDDDYYGLYERAPNSRPNSASEMKKVD